MSGCHSLVFLQINNCQCDIHIWTDSGTNCIAEVASVYHALATDPSTTISPGSFAAAYTCCVCPSHEQATGAVGDPIALEMTKRI